MLALYSPFAEPAAPGAAVFDTLPVTELADAATLVGQCLRYGADGTYRAEACPRALTAMFARPARKQFTSGTHELQVMWVEPGKPVLGFRGDGGYYQAHEAHVVEVHTAVFRRTLPEERELAALDMLCQQTGAANDRAVVTRAFGGCAMVRRGMQSCASPPYVSLDQIASSGERWGRPVNFLAGAEREGLEEQEAEETGGHEAGAATCDDDLIAIKVRVSRTWVEKTRCVRARSIEASSLDSSQLGISCVWHAVCETKKHLEREDSMARNDDTASTPEGLYEELIRFAREAANNARARRQASETPGSHVEHAAIGMVNG